MVGDGGNVESHLRLLENDALIYEERTVPRIEYAFRHVLTREAVYAGVPDSERRRLHEQAASVILRLCGDRPEPHLEQLAYHYEQAGIDRQAVRYLHLAGRKAIRSSDNQAAIGLLERALSLVCKRRRSRKRDKIELQLLTTLGVPVTAITGYGSPRTREVYRRAVDLSAPEDSSTLAFAARHGLWRYHQLRAEVDRALALAEQLVETSRQTADESMQMEAQRALGCALTHAGRLTEASEVFDRAMALYNPARHRSNAFVYGHDPATTFY
jgi:predicted ATPase